MNSYNQEFVIPIKEKWTPFKRCEECKKKKLSVTLYKVHDTGLISYIKYHVCRKCLKEAKFRVKNENI